MKQGNIGKIYTSKWNHLPKSQLSERARSMEERQMDLNVTVQKATDLVPRTYERILTTIKRHKDFKMGKGTEKTSLQNRSTNGQ